MSDPKKHDVTGAAIAKGGDSVTIKVTRDDNPYKTFANLADYAREQARNSDYAKDLDCLTALLASAFELEGFLNFLGGKQFPVWEKAELDRLRPIGKLRLIAEKLGVEVNTGERPYETFVEIFSFRNKMVHPKDFRAEETLTVDFDNVEHRKPPTAPWEDRCNLDYVGRVLEDTDKIVDQLWTAAGHKGSPFTSHSHGEEVKKEKGDES